MKQLLFLLLFPAYAMAQYPGNAGQKITLGEQTTADGLVYRGLAADTTRKPSVDTMAYILLDTNTNIIWQYKKATSNAWTRVGGSISSGLTGVLPVANGGTGQTTLAAAGIVTGTGNTNYIPKFTSSSAIGNSIAYIQGNEFVIQGTTNGTLNIRSTSGNSNYLFFTENGVADRYLIGSPAGSGDLVFRSNSYDFTNGSERMRITSGGEVWIDYTTDQGAYKLQVKDSVYVGGNVSASAYTTRSDYDLKDEIQNISYGINEVMQMQPVKYIYKSNGSTQLGFIAQDLGVITPEVVSFEDKISVYYNALIPILTKAIQEQQALIKALEQRIINLENK